MKLSPISFSQQPNINSSNENKNNLKKTLLTTALITAAAPAYIIIDSGDSYKDFFALKGLKNFAKLGVICGIGAICLKLIDKINLKDKRVEAETKLAAQSMLGIGSIGLTLLLRLGFDSKKDIKTLIKSNKKLLLGFTAFSIVAPHLRAFHNTYLDLYAQKHANQPADKTIDKC